LKKILAWILLIIIICLITTSIAETITYQDYTVLHFSVFINETFLNEKYNYFLISYNGEEIEKPIIWINMDTMCIKMTGTSFTSIWEFKNDMAFNNLVKVFLNQDIFDIKYYGDNIVIIGKSIINE
jgi:hypothetical protein